jgi:hypothetical protein
MKNRSILIDVEKLKEMVRERDLRIESLEAELS